MNSLGGGFKVSHVDVVICIASVVIDNKAMTCANFNWELCAGDEIKEEFGFNSVKMLNDFEACGYALTGLDSSEVIALGDAPEFKFRDGDNDRRFLVVGPGTGLGVVLTIVKLAENMIFSTEGGNMGIEPIDEKTSRYIKYVKNKLGCTGIISVEKLFCGRGIPFIYQFLMEENGDKDKIEDIGSIEIVRRATEGEEGVYSEVIKMFLTIFGTALCNLSCSLLPRNGIVLC